MCFASGTIWCQARFPEVLVRGGVRVAPPLPLLPPPNFWGFLFATSLIFKRLARASPDADATFLPVRLLLSGDEDLMLRVVSLVSCRPYRTLTDVRFLKIAACWSSWMYWVTQYILNVLLLNTQYILNVLLLRNPRWNISMRSGCSALFALFANRPWWLFSAYFVDEIEKIPWDIGLLLADDAYPFVSFLCHWSAAGLLFPPPFIRLVRA